MKTAIEISQIADGALLAVGDCNHDFTLSRYDGGKGGKPSRSVRAVPKEGSGCAECGFGSVRYWANYVRNEPDRVQLTDEGAALFAASHKELEAIGGAW